jgi:hypothetical protein
VNVWADTTDNGYDAVTGDFETLVEAMTAAADYARDEGWALRSRVRYGVPVPYPVSRNSRRRIGSSRRGVWFYDCEIVGLRDPGP